MINKTYLRSIVILGGVLLLLNATGAFAVSISYTNAKIVSVVLEQLVIPLFLGICISLCVFVCGLIRYSWGFYKKNDALRKHGKKIMFWGAIALFAGIILCGFVVYGVNLIDIDSFTMATTSGF
jgi:hypothetical protein